MEIMGREKIHSFLDYFKNEPVLEIGPLDNPFLTKDKYNVYYADIKMKFFHTILLIMLMNYTKNFIIE